MTGLERHESAPAVNVDDETLKYLGYDPANVATRALVLLALRYDLDPLLGEIMLIPGREGNRVYVSRDGMLQVAHRSGALDGIEVEQRRNSTNDGWTAFVSVYRKDMSHPFRYGAQCKDTEPQAKAGNGPEIALARAERRALRRAFQIRTDFYPDRPNEELDLEVEHFDRTDPDGSPSVSVDDHLYGSQRAARRPGDWRPSLDDQGDAHRIIGELDDDTQERFLADWRIDDFHAAWPGEAVVDALSRRR